MVDRAIKSPDQLEVKINKRSDTISIKQDDVRESNLCSLVQQSNRQDPISFSEAPQKPKSNRIPAGHVHNKSISEETVSTELLKLGSNRQRSVVLVAEIVHRLHRMRG